MPVNNLKLDKVKNTNFAKKMSWTFPVGVLFLLFCNDAVANNAPRQAPQLEAKTENGRVVMPSWDDVLLGVTSSASSRGRRRS